MNSPLFITFEGIEACGKSTQLARAVTALTQAGREVVATREPGGTDIGDAIRAILLSPEHDVMSAHAELLLYNAARAQHVAQVIRPALARGAIVVCDRYADATYAYQGAARGLSAATLDALHAIATDDLWPALTFLFDLSTAESCARMTLRGQARDRLEQESRDFHTAVRKAYLARAAAAPHRFVVLDAMQSIDAVHAQVMAAIEKRLK